MTRMYNPPHPGEVLRDGVFTDTGITVTGFATRIGVTRVALSRVLNGRAAISADMAVRLAAALGGSAESWLHMSGLVRIRGQPAVVPKEVVDSLRLRQDPETGACAGRPLFKPGASVAFRGGPFKGLEGVFELETADDRVVVLLEFLGKINRVRVCRDWVVPAA